MPSPQPHPQLLLTQSQIGRAVGIGQRELQRRWMALVPIDAVVGTGPRKRYTLDAVAAIVAGLRQRDAERGAAASDGDPDLFGDDSPALERYRTARAQLAELDLEVRRAKLLDREQLESHWNAGAVALRNAGERLQRRYGDEAVEIYNEGMADFARAVTEAIHAGHDRDSTGGLPGDLVVAGRAAHDQPAKDAAPVRGAGARGPKRAVRGGKVQD